MGRVRMALNLPNSRRRTSWSREKRSGPLTTKPQPLSGGVVGWFMLPRAQSTAPRCTRDRSRQCPSMADPIHKPSLIDLALDAKAALILGLGGGGDVIQSIPVVNLLRKLGVESIITGGVSCQWWTPDGNPLADEWGTAVMGPTIYDAGKLEKAESWARHVVAVNSESHLDGRQPCEAKLAGRLGEDAMVVCGLTGGVQGLADSLREVVEARGIDLIVGVDIGSDSFHNGQEAVPAKTSMVDFMSLASVVQQPCATVYGVAGYGCDGEMELSELDERVATVMKAGGYLGAHGLTQSDVATMVRASEIYPDPVEPMSFKAAQGELGLHNVWTHGPWGTVVRVTPLAAVMMFFDPRTMAEVNSKGILALQPSTSLGEAETIFKEKLGQFPESRLKPVIRFFD